MKKIFYSKASYGKKRNRCSSKSFKNPLFLMDGPRVKEFETKVAKIFGKNMAYL